MSTPDWEAFGREVLETMLDHVYGGDLDGGDVQEMGVKHGVLVETLVTEPCDEHSCICAESGDFPEGRDFPTTCFRIAGADSREEAAP